MRQSGRSIGCCSFTGAEEVVSAQCCSLGLALLRSHLNMHNVDLQVVHCESPMNLGSFRAMGDVLPSTNE
jgi:hypothetical protein